MCMCVCVPMGACGGQGVGAPRAGGMSSCELPNLGFGTRTQSLCTHAVTHRAISQPIAYNILNRGWKRINGIVMHSLKSSREDSQKLPNTNPIFPTANPVLGERRLQETWPRQGKGSDDEKGREAGPWVGPQADLHSPLLTLLSPTLWSLQLFLEQFWPLRLLSASARRKSLVNYSSQKGRRAKRRNPVTGWGDAAERINSFYGF